MDKIHDKTAKVFRNVQKKKVSLNVCLEPGDYNKDVFISKTELAANTCCYCPKVFFNSNYLLKHMLRRHAEDLISVHRKCSKKKSCNPCLYLLDSMHKEFSTFPLRTESTGNQVSKENLKDNDLSLNVSGKLDCKGKESVTENNCVNQQNVPHESAFNTPNTVINSERFNDDYKDVRIDDERDLLNKKILVLENDMKGLYDRLELFNKEIRNDFLTKQEANNLFADSEKKRLADQRVLFKDLKEFLQNDIKSVLASQACCYNEQFSELQGQIQRLASLVNIIKKRVDSPSHLETIENNIEKKIVSFLSRGSNLNRSRSSKSTLSIHNSSPIKKLPIYMEKSIFNGSRPEHISSTSVFHKSEASNQTMYGGNKLISQENTSTPIINILVSSPRSLVNPNEIEHHGSSFDVSCDSKQDNCESFDDSQKHAINDNYHNGSADFGCNSKLGKSKSSHQSLRINNKSCVSQKSVINDIEHNGSGDFSHGSKLDKSEFSHKSLHTDSNFSVFPKSAINHIVSNIATTVKSDSKLSKSQSATEVLQSDDKSFISQESILSPELTQPYISNNVVKHKSFFSRKSVINDIECNSQRSDSVLNKSQSMTKVLHCHGKSLISPESVLSPEQAKLYISNDVIGGKTFVSQKSAIDDIDHNNTRPDSGFSKSKSIAKTLPFDDNTFISQKSDLSPSKQTKVYISNDVEGDRHRNATAPVATLCDMTLDLHSLLEETMSVIGLAPGINKVSCEDYEKAMKYLRRLMSMQGPKYTNLFHFYDDINSSANQLASLKLIKKQRRNLRFSLPSSSSSVKSVRKSKEKKTKKQMSSVVDDVVNSSVNFNANLSDKRKQLITVMEESEDNPNNITQYGHVGDGDCFNNVSMGVKPTEDYNQASTFIVEGAAGEIIHDCDIFNRNSHDGTFFDDVKATDFINTNASPNLDESVTLKKGEAIQLEDIYSSMESLNLSDED